MGNGFGKICLCSTGAGEVSRRHDFPAALTGSLDKDLCNSFCYVRPDPFRTSSCFNIFSEDGSTQTTFRSISGASLSANSSAPLSTLLPDFLPYSSTSDSGASFSSTSFASVPLLSGVGCNNMGSGPIEMGLSSGKFRRSLSHSGLGSRKGNLLKAFQRAISSKFSHGQRDSAPVRKSSVSVESKYGNGNVARNNLRLTNDYSYEEEDLEEEKACVDEFIQNVHWAQGKAGEDCMQIVISEDHRWVFVGIYDGFYGPDATDFLLSNLFYFVQNELKDLLCNCKLESKAKANYVNAKGRSLMVTDLEEGNNHETPAGNGIVYGCSTSTRYNEEKCHLELDLGSDSKRMIKVNKNRRNKGVAEVERFEAEVIRWKTDGCSTSYDEELGNKAVAVAAAASEDINNFVLLALAEALRKAEDAYMEKADKMSQNHPELAMMGSCVLVMLMKGQDIYLMNLGDSRAVLAQDTEYDVGFGKTWTQLSLKNGSNFKTPNVFGFNSFSCLTSLQLTEEHSTHVEEEVKRILNEHPDDPYAVKRNRVKGCLNVTRAFGAGFLKQPKRNDTLMEEFKIDYVGESPYLISSPSLCHHKLSPRDRFLILSSDGLYQYLTIEEAVSKVESFITQSPERDPAQLLIQEVLSRAAKKAGMEFHELLDIPKGETRRHYHDDISIVIISLDGIIWRSSV